MAAAATPMGMTEPEAVPMEDPNVAAGF
jgi:hypothetical protein